MGFAVGVSRRAESDLADAIDWYNIQPGGLGDQFRLQFELESKAIVEASFRWPPYHKTIRRFLMHRFPYVVYYDTVGEHIRILRVVHCSRDPEAVKRSLG